MKQSSWLSPRPSGKVWLGLLLMLVLASCGSPGNAATSDLSPQGFKYGGAVTIVPSPVGSFKLGPKDNNFNPLAPQGTLRGTKGMIYETLLFFNVENGDIKPWLATSYHWSIDVTTLALTLRQGVTWSDGQPFTSNDVVFTLNLLHQYPALAGSSLWNAIQSVTNPDAHTVIVKFKYPSVPLLWQLGGQMYILPEHIWKDVKDPVTEVNANPVGTGPFMTNPQLFDSELYVLKRNPHYWQPGKPYVDELRYPAYTSNISADLLLAQGSTDWTGLFVSNVQNTFVKTDSAHNHYWFPPSNVVMLYMNLTKYPFTLPAVRQAINVAIDREKLNMVAESGYEPPAHPTGLILPTNQNFLVPDYKDMAYTKKNVAQANTLLTSAGFMKGMDGIYQDKTGTRLAFNIDVVSGWTDWEKSCQLIADALKDAGIAATVTPLSYSDYMSALAMGNFDTAISSSTITTTTGPTPYYLYDTLLNSSNTAPIGKLANGNWERWSDPATDQLLAQYARTTDLTMQRQALYGLQRIMVQQVPAIPLVYGATWYEYSTSRFVGWPDEKNPYAMPAPYSDPDSEIVVLNLHLA
ncbi:MAG TPA: ABC transporter substrate-binding protein [Ktedonobacteraceae bacterium]|nr:ABC transporter substrate-binding protein [Ktedonobacteraceae bacterium]